MEHNEIKADFISGGRVVEHRMDKLADAFIREVQGHERSHKRPVACPTGVTEPINQGTEPGRVLIGGDV